MEREIPLESNDLYSISQQNVHTFFNEIRKSLFQYRQSMTNLQLECIKSCGIILNPALPFNQKFTNKSIISSSPPPKMMPPTQQTKNEEKTKAAKEPPIPNHTPSEFPPLQSSSKISSEEIRPSKPASEKKRKFHAEKFWKNAYAHQRGNLLRMVKVQDEQIKILANEHYSDLPTSVKHDIEKSGIQKEDLK